MLYENCFITLSVFEGITRKRSFLTFSCLAYFLRFSVCNLMYFGKLDKSSLAGLLLLVIEGEFIEFEEVDGDSSGWDIDR